MNDLEQNLRRVRERIAAAAEHAGRAPGDITLVAVTKTFPVETLVAARALGLDQFGENRVPEAADKIPLVNRQVQAPVTWHLIGHIQHRKIRDAATLFDFIHSVDSEGLARRLDDRLGTLNKVMPVLIEINVSGETTKYGLPLEPRGQLYKTVEEILSLSQLDVQGLMTIAPIVAEPEAARPYFRALAQLREQLRERFPARAWRHLSMGMTDDFEAAIAEGATIVRIGRALFGERPHV